MALPKTHFLPYQKKLENNFKNDGKVLLNFVGYASTSLT